MQHFVFNRLDQINLGKQILLSENEIYYMKL